MENNNIINGNCWLACFDILGFTNEVKFAETKDKNNFILGMCEYLYDEIELIKQFEEIEQGLVNIVWFSDTFIFYSPNDSKECLKAIESVVRGFFRTAFTANWHSQYKPTSGCIPIPLRGCLNYGHFYADSRKNIYWGSAFNEAYKLAENQDWIGYALSEKAKSQIDKYHLNYWKTIEPYYKEYNVQMKDIESKKLCAYYAGEHKVSDLDILRERAGSDLADGLFRMWINIKDFDKLCDEQKQKIIKKYENTKKFLSEVYPSIQSLLENIGK